jgi:Cu/Zn superoxide dismutase
MHPPASSPRLRRRRAWLGSLALATSALCLIATAGTGAAAPPARLDLSSKQHKHQTSHKPQKGKSQQSTNHPCLEGNWNVTSITLSTTGLTFTGGAGTTVDIMSNGNALGNFTPGAPLTGTEGSAKFNGTVTDHYGFSPKTTSHAGTFPVSTVTDDATITVAGATRAVTSSPEQGSYSCTGKDLSLTFTSGGSTLAYQLSPAG